MTQAQRREHFWKSLEAYYAVKDGIAKLEKRLNKKHWLKRLFRL